ncbi:uncharacterized protein LOC134235775 [Saccostrea cucullata]|uniref:uncharacterized protein LOC134235775 n=1 Tax=Saccostrea cuccullata TaxID=36930 RepID=UPI002ED3186F
MADPKVFALIEWEDNYVSIINIDAICQPRKEIEKYEEGEYIRAKFKGTMYSAVIAEISAFSSRKRLGQSNIRLIPEKTAPAPDSDETDSPPATPLNTGKSEFRDVFVFKRFPVNEVDSCPTTNVTWYEAGARLNCSHDFFNRLQYLCIPNQEKTTLLEFCYDKIMGLYEKGHCLHLSTSGFVDQEDCDFFIEGCPKTPYYSSTIFQFLKCLEINRDLRCFSADLDCYTRTTYNQPNNCNDMSGNCNYTPLEPKPTAEDIRMIIRDLFKLIVLLCVIIAFSIAICCWRKNNMPKIRKEISAEVFLKIYIFKIFSLKKKRSLKIKFITKYTFSAFLFMA